MDIKKLIEICEELVGFISSGGDCGLDDEDGLYDCNSQFALLDFVREYEKLKEQGENE